LTVAGNVALIVSSATK